MKKKNMKRGWCSFDMNSNEKKKFSAAAAASNNSKFKFIINKLVYLNFNYLNYSFMFLIFSVG